MSDVTSAKAFNEAFRRAEANLNAMAAKRRGIQAVSIRLPEIGETGWAPILEAAMVSLANLTATLAR